MPYSNGLILDSRNNYGIVKTETVFGFGPPIQDNFINSTFSDKEPLQWIFSHTPFERRSLQGSVPIKALTYSPQERSKAKIKKRNQKKLKKKHHRGGKLKKCILKVFKKGKKKRRNKYGMKSKYMLPLILGLLAAKSMLIPIVLKALTFISAKGLMLGFFSTALASVLSLKGMFDHSHGYYQNRKDDAKTQVEIIQVPSKNEDHYYNDEYYKRKDHSRMVQ